MISFSPQEKIADENRNVAKGRILNFFQYLL